MSHWIRIAAIVDLDVITSMNIRYRINARDMYPVLTFRCRNCNTQLPLAVRANDVGGYTEIGAARLHAGYMDCNDLDDVINDPVLRNILGHMIGECDLDPAAVEIYDLAMEMQSDG